MLKLLFALFFVIASAAGGCVQVDRINQGLTESRDTIRSKIKPEDGATGEAAPEPKPGEPAVAAAPATPAKPAPKRVAAVPLQSADLTPDTAAVMDELLLASLESRKFEAIGKDDIAQLLGHERNKTLLGCEGDSCLAELGGALGVDYLVAGKLANVEGTLILTLKLLDTKKAKVVSRTNRTTKGGKSVLPKMIAESVGDLADAVGMPAQN